MVQGVPAVGLLRMIASTISHYRVLEKLGGGGMGVVHKAEDTKLGRLVTLEFLPDKLSRDKHARERLQRKASAASALNHPHMCSAYAIGEAYGRCFIALVNPAKFGRGPAPLPRSARAGFPPKPRAALCNPTCGPDGTRPPPGCECQRR